MVKIFLNIFSGIFLLLSLILITPQNSFSQSWTSTVSQDGFILQKVVSDTVIASGQPFSYTIYYSVPAGAANVMITDVLPPNLIFLGYTVGSGCSTPTVTAPAVNSMGGTINVSYASIGVSCASSITITVAFPNGITCPGTSVRNHACLYALFNGKDLNICTNDIMTTAQSSNPWHINKYPVGLAWIGGNCPWATGSDTVTYQICVYKDVGTTGQLNLLGGTVVDTLPAGAQFISSTCGATVSGNIITWNVGNMSALPAYNSACCQFKIYYPVGTFPSGSFLSNSVTLNGSLGDSTQPCSNFQTSASTCVKKEIIQNFTIGKWVYTNRQPGCSGRYLITLCNSGTVTMPITAIDTLPTLLSGYSISYVYPSSFNVSLTGNMVNVADTLAPGQCAYIYVDFTIPSSTPINTVITNCAWITSIIPNPSYCTSFTVDAPAAKPCLWKEVCNKQTSYTPGSIFRYRLRVQNIGGLALTGSTITDVLNPNLEYVGNPSYYVLNTWYAPNCNPTPNPGDVWNGVSLLYNSGTNTVTALLPNIPASCQNIFYNACGMYGTSGVPYYYIEFDVKVRDTSALGNVPNEFSLAGGSLGSSTYTSNTENVLVVGVVGMNIQKDVKLPNDTTFSSSLLTTAGSNVVFRLKMNSSGTAALTHVSFADLLPLDFNPSDNKILQLCGVRGSQYNISYVSPTGTPIPVTPAIFNNTTTSLANVNNFAPTGIPGAAFNIGCGSAGTWGTGISPGDKNFALYFGPTAVGTSGAEYQFTGKIDPTAKEGTHACNTFAASGWSKHLIQGNIINYLLAGQLESSPVCITIDTVDNKPCIEELKVTIDCLEKNPDTGYWTYSVTLSGNSCAPGTLNVSSPHGSFAPNNYTIASTPWTFNTTYIDASGANPFTIKYSVTCGNDFCRDSIILDLPECDTTPVEHGCCDNFIKIIKDPKIIWNSATGYVGMSQSIGAGPAPIQKFSATIVNAQLRRVCGQSAQPWQRIFGDITGGALTIPPNPGPQLLTLFSREAIWGPATPCVDWNKMNQLKLHMVFPPFSGNKLCYDTLRFGIRYSFTDCNCLTCDTVVFYTIVRRPAILPWDPTGDIHFQKYQIPEMKGNDNYIQADPPSVTSLAMESKTNGSFWIVSPDVPENVVTIKGVEFYAPDVNFDAVIYNTTPGTVDGHNASIDVEAAPGDTREILLSFINETMNTFDVYVVFKYTIEGVEDILNSDPVHYYAIVPGLGPDVMGVDLGTKPSGVTTYSIYLHNKNGYDENIAAVSINTVGDYEILAVGPPQSNESGVTIMPRLQDDGTYLISIPESGMMVLPGTVVKPIFLTISGVTDVDPEINFITFNEFGSVLSEGTFKLSDPISIVNDNSQNEIGMTVYPNPVSNSATLTFSLTSDLRNATISIYDLLGNKVDELFMEGNLDSGTHLLNFNTMNMMNGSYFIKLTSQDKQDIIKFTIVK
ncbi:MAG: hypothetical protein A2X64_03710 [Ignavibacteria bacterium GWF2_33_9]|nr:MAG: hypothetical protein A2X64_03710 [Ignavibacteria bacterium GWF2_33_9]